MVESPCFEHVWKTIAHVECGSWCAVSKVEEIFFFTFVRVLHLEYWCSRSNGHGNFSLLVLCVLPFFFVLEIFIICGVLPELCVFEDRRTNMNFFLFWPIAHHRLWLHGLQVFGLFRWLEKVRNMKLRKLSCKVKPNRADDLFHCMLYEFLTGWWQVNPDELAALRKSSHCATCKPELMQWARTDFASIQSHPLVKLPLLLICRSLQLKIVC